jgi:hypothetical protein
VSPAVEPSTVSWPFSPKNVIASGLPPNTASSSSSVPQVGPPGVLGVPLESSSPQAER